MKVGIIGGGITGLTIALRLARNGHGVTVFEQDCPGGLASGFTFSETTDTTLERYYHHIFSTDHAFIRLIAENDLNKSLIWSSSSTGICSNGRVLPFGNAKDVLSFSPLGSIWQRLLMGWNMYSFCRAKEWEHLDSVCCREYFERRWNATGFEKLWEPMLIRKFGVGGESIPASFLWGRIHPRGRSRQGGKELLGYLRGGFQNLFNVMVDNIRKAGGEVHIGVQINKIISGKPPALIICGEKKTFDRIVFTLPIETLPSSINNLASDIKYKTQSVQYVASTCMVLVMPQPLSRYYWINSIDPEIAFGVLVEHTNLVSPADYGGQHIVYLGAYHSQNKGIALWDENKVRQHFLLSLEKLFPHFKKECINTEYLFRTKYASPLYDLMFLKRIPPYQGWIEGVDICSMAQVYPVDRNMNNCVENAESYLGACYGV